jgi:hypothetical protein
MTCALIEQHGLTVAAYRDGSIDVRNPADAATDPRGQVLHRSLNQCITLPARESGLRFCWLRPGPTRNAPLDVESMVPIEDIAEAARRSAAILRVGGAER